MIAIRLEELIRKRLAESKELTELLTEYADGPAIFFGDAPDDNQRGWKGRKTMPRITFTYDTMADKERKSAGSLYVSIYCKNSGEGAAFPEDIVPSVTKLLRDVFFAPDDFGIFCCSWKSTDSFSVNEKPGSNVAYTNNQVVGCDVIFDILEYPDQTSTDPDPVMALNEYIADVLGEAVVLYRHNIPDCIEASNDQPVVYVRNAGYSLARQTNTVSWMKGTLYVHLVCPDSSVRMKMITALANKIASAGEIIMLDGSPMFISAIEGDNSADYMVSGQMKLETAYGVLKTKPLGAAMKDVVISERR